MAKRVLMLTWEYPPIVEGGLARHARKLAEQLVRAGVEVHVLTRGSQASRDHDLDGGVRVHRVAEPEYPEGLNEFVAWVRQMNDDLLAAGRTLAAELEFDVVHAHDWLVAVAAKRLADASHCPLVATIHATEYGRHQGWVHVAPQSDIHRTERWMTHAADQVIVCSHYMRGHVADIFDLDESRIAVIPNGIDPADLDPVADLATLRATFAEPHERLVLLVGRLVYEKGFQVALDALPGVIERCGNVRFLVAGSGTADRELREQAARLGLDEHGSFVGWIGDDVFSCGEDLLGPDDRRALTMLSLHDAAILDDTVRANLFASGAVRVLGRCAAGGSGHPDHFGRTRLRILARRRPVQCRSLRILTTGSSVGK